MTPGRAGVAPVNQFEETGDDSLFVAQVEMAHDQPFGELVECKDRQRQRGDAAVGLFKIGIGGGHE